MPTLILCDTSSAQTLTNKTLTAPIVTDPVITGADITLAAAPTATLEAATKGYVDSANNTIIVNGSLDATVAGNNLTLHLKTAAGATPSATDSVRATFRSVTDGVGSLVTRTITGATTFVIASSSTLDTLNAQSARIWVGLLDNAGTVELCAWNPLGSTTLSLMLFPQPLASVSTTAEGTGAADSSGVIYSTTARSAKAFLPLGYIEITEATAGVWATAPTVIQTYREGIKRTGDVLSSVFYFDAAVATGTTAMPTDNTIPQITEGNEYMGLSVQSRSLCNILNTRAQGVFAHTAVTTVNMALFEDGTNNALAVSAVKIPASNDVMTCTINHRRRVSTLSLTAYRIRAGASTGATTTFNGSAGAQLFGGVCNSMLEVSEVMV